MGGKAANLNSVLENQDSDLHQQVAFSDTTDTIHAFYVQISDKQKKVWSSAFRRSAVFTIRVRTDPRKRGTPNSNSGAIENRFYHSFGLKHFPSQGVSGPGMLRVIRIDLLHSVDNVAEASER